MKNDALKMYSKYHLERDDERLGLFLRLSEKYAIKKVLYPGSFVHLTPALVFPLTYFVDSDRRAKKFFDSPEVSEYVSNHKIYKSDAEFIFHLSDYNKGIPEQPNSFDLLISQYAGFVSQACKQYLKIVGILVANNSHGDASMASVDPEFEFIGVINRRNSKFKLSSENLNSYFIPKKKIEISREYIESIGRGVGYTKTAFAYIFRKV
ncbi:hypothetical protein H8E77_06880 [bacterium]|nr:hypothetical protein [bacterium]